MESHQTQQRRRQSAIGLDPSIQIKSLAIETSAGGFENVLVISDHFTRFAQAIPTKNQTARTTAEALFTTFIGHYGFPERLHSDQGANFKSKIIKELCQLAGMAKPRTSPYHPMGNGQTERFNQTLLGMLGTLDADKKREWHKSVAPLTHDYNSTTHQSTEYSPYYLMFGREARLPIDTIFGLERGMQTRDHTSYDAELRKRLQDAYQIAASTAGEAQQRQKDWYGSKSREGTLQPVDRVLVRILAFEGKHKLSDRWEYDVYFVDSQPNPDIPVFVVRKENDRSYKRKLHRNHLLPIGSRCRDEPAASSKRGQDEQARDLRQKLHGSDQQPQPSEPIHIEGDKQETATIAQLVADSSEVHGQVAGDRGTDPNGDDQTPTESVEGGGPRPSLETETRQGLENVPEAVQPDTQLQQKADQRETPAETNQEGAIRPEIHTTIDSSDNRGSAEVENHNEGPEVRRSNRNRQAPTWMTSGQYSMAQQAVGPEWKRKIAFLSYLMDSRKIPMDPATLSETEASILTQ
ncbi:Pol polyprotein [Elysia marginata]|uniref:Pol polyprotein n=1 Tax=Elysia marginata TaxID=1093978 RepID=A0AAV4HJQ8_9GAST|nr:Pol polyprotein [Elysia marginata]